ncbi:MAG: hypothetical protein GY696_38105 [Gammaproteobacteria bacterium]|nr:hypothetical protein [Gammaproteobacteria bacterium]
MKCPEEGPGPRGQTAPKDHILMEMQVRIQLEQLRSSYGQVNSERDHLRLPCLVRENGCQILQKTYVWHGATGDCHLKYIRAISPNQTQGTWLVDHRHQLLLNVTRTYPVPNCKIVLETTQLINLYLADLTIPEQRQVVKDLPKVSAREVNMQRETGVALEYTTYNCTNRLRQQVMQPGHAFASSRGKS